MADSGGFDGLARALRELHRALMERARRDYERERLMVVSPGELLKLLTTDDAFAWLRELSELMADVDIVRDAPADALEATAAAIRPAVEHLLGTPDSGGAFAQRYWGYVHDEPNVAIAHAGVKQALNAFPRGEADASSADRRRHLAEQALALGRRGRT
jgi:hypothetical protein